MFLKSISIRSNCILLFYVHLLHIQCKDTLNEFAMKVKLFLYNKNISKSIKYNYKYHGISSLTIKPMRDCGGNYQESRYSTVWHWLWPCSHVDLKIQSFKTWHVKGQIFVWHVSMPGLKKNLNCTFKYILWTKYHTLL